MPALPDTVFTDQPGKSFTLLLIIRLPVSDSMSSAKEFKPYRIRITTAELNIREKADSCSLSKGFTGIGTFTIVNETVDYNNQKWGLLKSYEKKCDGWITLLDTCTLRI